jgi:hypothetical protein
MDVWGFEHVQPWLEAREKMPVGPLFCVLDGRTCRRAWSAGAAPAKPAPPRGPRGRAAEYHQRELGQQNLGVTSIYLQGIDAGEIIETSHARRAPMIPG